MVDCSSAHMIPYLLERDDTEVVCATSSRLYQAYQSAKMALGESGDQCLELDNEADQCVVVGYALCDTRDSYMTAQRVA